MEKDVLVDDLENYDLLDKNVINLYDMIKTKNEVFNIISNYKQNKFLYFSSLRSLDKITSNPNFNISRTNNVSDKIADNIANKLDSMEGILTFEKTINLLYEELHPVEKRYYTTVISNNGSETSVAQSYGLSKEGLKPFKNSCLLKIALAFNVAVER